VVRPIVLLVALAACSGRPSELPRPPPLAALTIDDLPAARAADEGLDAAKLGDLAETIRNTEVLSLLISRHGKLIFELYTSRLGREEAHYLMSATKTVLSTAIGAAIDRGLITTPDASVSDLLPRALFASDADVARFRAVTLKDVMGMSALDSPDPPRVHTPEAVDRARRFHASASRAAFALTQAILPSPGVSYQYNDVTPMLASGALAYGAKKSPFDFAEETLFRPMGFRNEEWMHEDASGVDNGGYGMRLRPTDMQKLGILFLNRGLWNGTRLLSEAWIDRAFSPWNNSHAGVGAPNYGWFWWQDVYGEGWTTHLAKGWKGQRIAVVPEQALVVTMTAIIQSGDEDKRFTRMMQAFVVPAVTSKHVSTPEDETRLRAILDELRSAPPRWPDDVEPRMIPSVAPKERHRPFSASR
jgi:CubicO group peptidase (beta-lactamase class C family)